MKKLIITLIMIIITGMMVGCNYKKNYEKLSVQYQEGVVRNSKIFNNDDKDFISFKVLINDAIKELNVKKLKTSGNVDILETTYTKVSETDDNYIYIINLYLQYYDNIIYDDWKIELTINGNYITLNLNNITVDNKNQFDDTTGIFKIDTYIQGKNFYTKTDFCMANNEFSFKNTSNNEVQIKSIKSSIAQNIEKIMINSTYVEGVYVVYPHETVDIKIDFRIPLDYHFTQYYIVDYQINDSEYTNYTPNFYTSCSIKE